MSEYQAVYDAVRSRFHCSVDGDVIANRIADHFYNAGQQMTQAGMIACSAEGAKMRPSVLFRPRVCIDGNQWCAIYGENVQDGVCGFGDSPEAAMLAFDAAWGTKLAGGTP